MLAITPERVLPSAIVALAELAAERAIKVGPIDAAIAAEAAGWYVARVAPGQERIAAAHLAGRRFGIFLADAPVHYRAGSRLRQVCKLVLPGYVLIWTWPTDSNWNRIMACPGVLGMLAMAGDTDGRPVQIPAAFVEGLRNSVTAMWTNPATVYTVAQEPKGRKLRKGKNKRGKKARARKSRLTE